jgi:hypothetical protein
MENPCLQLLKHQSFHFALGFDLSSLWFLTWQGLLYELGFSEHKWLLGLRLGTSQDVGNDCVSLVYFHLIDVLG